MTWLNTLESADQIALLLALLSILAAILLNAFQVRQQRQSNVLKNKQDVYRQFLRALADNIGFARDKEKLSETTNEIVRLRMEIVLVGSDQVISMLDEVGSKRKRVNEPGGAAEYVDAVGRLVLAMRRDGFPKTKVREHEIGKLLPLNP